MTISFSGLTFQIQLLYPGTERFFAGFLTDSPSYTACLRVTQEDLRQAACYCPADASPEFLETVALRRRLADLLLSHDRCLFHSAAMVFREQAYLFAAPSGTGKTTQLNLWRELYPEETTILNGDKPVLQFLDTGTIVVHASPWRGKESLGGTGSAPLGGIIYLRQSHAAWGCHSSHAGPVFLHRPDGRALSAPAAAAQAAGVCNPHLALGKPGRAGICPALPRPITRKKGVCPMLKTRPGVVHEEICGEHLLVATQAARRTCRHWALQLNDAGYFIWKLLEETPCQKDALLQAFSEHYTAPMAQATAYVGQFLEQMLSNGFVYETEAAES